MSVEEGRSKEGVSLQQGTMQLTIAQYSYEADNSFKLFRQFDSVRIY